MQFTHNHNQTERAVRTDRGFTLIELLVVMAIIIFLATVSTVVVANLLDTAREDATQTTIIKVNKLIEMRVAAFERWLKRTQIDPLPSGERQPPRPVINMMVQLQRQQGVYNIRAQTAALILRKQLFLGIFPQRFGDMTDSDGNNIPDLMDQDVANGKLSLSLGTHDPITESSELLYYALTRMQAFGVAPMEPDSFTSAEVADTDQDGLMEFIDAWGNPLRFYRWPTRLIRPGGPGTNITSSAAVDGLPNHVTGQRELADLLIKSLPRNTGANLFDPLNTDPEDPTRFYSRQLREPQANTFVAAFNRPNFEGFFHTPDTYHVPLVVSAGADGILGLYEPNYVDYDMDADGNVDAFDYNQDTVAPTSGVQYFFETEDGNQNGSFDGVLGTLAQPLQPSVSPVPAWPSSNSVLSTDADVINALSDNISNRNRRA